LATVFERVRKVAIAQLGVQENEVSPDSSFSADLGADSLDQVEMMMALEEEFSTPERKVSIPDEESEKMLTVQDAVDYLHGIGVSDMQAPPRQVEKSGFPRINLPRPGMPRPNFNRPGQPRQEKPGQPRQGGQNQPRGGEQRGGEQRRDNRPRRDRQPSNQPRQNFNQRQGQLGQPLPPAQPRNPIPPPPPPARPPEPPAPQA
jgi:acyl carrier protein